MCQLYTPRVCDCKSQSRVCKLKQIIVDNRKYSDRKKTQIKRRTYRLNTILSLIKGPKQYCFHFVS